MILDRSRGPSSRTPDRTNSFWISAESARAPFRRRKSADASITAFIPLSVRVNGAGRSTGCCCGADLRRGAGLRCGAFGRRDEGVEPEASRRSRSRHTSSYSWNKGCSCSSFRSSSRRSRSALIRSVIRYSCSNELKRKLLVARKAACKDRQPSAGAGHLRHFRSTRETGSLEAQWIWCCCVSCPAMHGSVPTPSERSKNLSKHRRSLLACAQLEAVVRSTAGAGRGNVRREAPVLLTLEDRSIAEGVLDLAFREETSDFDGWSVVDFKTDQESSAAAGHYVAQVDLYVRAVRAATELPARGIVLVV